MSHTSCERFPISSAIRERKASRRSHGTKPRTRASPLVGWSSPESIFSVVVLPAPFGPRKPTTSPGSISNAIPSTARTSRHLRRRRLFVAARSPASRSGTLKTFVSAETRTVGSPTGEVLATRDNGQVRILLVSQMYPGPDAPDLGVFVKRLADELAARGHVLERAVLDSRSGGKARYLGLGRRTFAAAR